jgi:DNA-binding beta-propeller fold protein YncE
VRAGVLVTPVRGRAIAAFCLVTALGVSGCTSRDRDDFTPRLGARPAAAPTTGGVPVPAASESSTNPASNSPSASNPATSSASLGAAAPASVLPIASTAPVNVSAVADPLPGMPIADNAANIYDHDGANMLSPVVARFPNLVYVPNSNSNTVDVINPSTGAIVEHFAVPAQPQHVVPSYDLKTLWVNSDVGNALTPINPATGLPGAPIAVADPYNLYFTPDGKYALVMAERLHRIDWRDPHTMALIHTTQVPCAGVNHADFSANGRYFIVSCEFDGRVLKIDTLTKQVVGVMQLTPDAMPQDVKVSPDGKVFYIADMQSNGVWEIDGDTFKKIGFVPTGKGAHGLYISRDASVMYVTNRGEGSISLIDLATGTVKTTWKIPGGGSPDMGGLSADGTQLWVSGRYNGVVYEISTVDGRLIREIKVGSGPHGLCVYPQPGRYSLGHTGVFR